VKLATNYDRSLFALEKENLILLQPSHSHFRQHILQRLRVESVEETDALQQVNNDVYRVIVPPLIWIIVLPQIYTLCIFPLNTQLLKVAVQVNF